MHLIKDELTVKILNGNVISKRVIEESLEPSEYLNNLNKIEFSITQSKENTKQNEDLLKKLEGGVKKDVRKAIELSERGKDGENNHSNRSKK